MTQHDVGNNKDDDQATLQPLRVELERLGATDVQLSLDDEFEPTAGTLLKVEIGEAFWHLPAQEFQTIVSDLADRCGSEAIKEAVESEGHAVWHGPAPKESRESSP